MRHGDGRMGWKEEGVGKANGVSGGDGEGWGRWRTRMRRQPHPCDA